MDEGSTGTQGAGETKTLTLDEARRRLLEAELIFGVGRKPGESDETYAVRQGQEDVLTIGIADGSIPWLPEYTKGATSDEAQRNARSFERNSGRTFEDNGPRRDMRSARDYFDL